MKHIQAANFTPVHSRVIDLLFVHDMEFKEDKEAAEDVAMFFHNQRKGDPNGSSAHVCFDNNSAVSCVWDHDVAWAAPGVNHNGWHAEFAGFSTQKPRDWHDKFSETMIFDIAVPVFARKALIYKIPTRLCEASDLKKGRSGISGHLFATEAFGPVGGHTDPGKNFPWDDFIKEVHLRKIWLKHH